MLATPRGIKDPAPHPGRFFRPGSALRIGVAPAGSLRLRLAAKHALALLLLDPCLIIASLSGHQIEALAAPDIALDAAAGLARIGTLRQLLALLARLLLRRLRRRRRLACRRLACRRCVCPRRGRARVPWGGPPGASPAFRAFPAFWPC